jgi:hypothetical protein
MPASTEVRRRLRAEGKLTGDEVTVDAVTPSGSRCRLQRWLRFALVCGSHKRKAVGRPVYLECLIGWNDRLWRILLKKSPYRDGQNFGASLMRLALGDARDHVDPHENNRRASYWT